MKLNSPQISVILPTYNREALLPRAIHSVLNQTYSNLELIVVDDCSTDNTEQAVKAINDDRLIYIRLEQNKGANYARNVGIKAAKSDYIAFQDSDDEWLPEKLSLQIKAFDTTHSKIGVVYCGYWNINPQGNKEFRPYQAIKPKDGNILKSLLIGNFITTQATLVRKSCFAEVGDFDETLPRYQDWDMFIRIAEKYEYLYIDQPLLITYFTHDSITANISKQISGHRLIFNKHQPLLYRYPLVYLKHVVTVLLGGRMVWINSQLIKYPIFKKLMRYILK